MKLNITPIKYGDLQPGDLFSLNDLDDWGSILSDDKTSGYDVQIRSNNPLKDWINTDYIVFLITIERK